MERTKRNGGSTAVGGPYLVSSKGGMTRADMVRVLEALRKEFGEGYDFALEGITEGGIKFTNWPGKDNVVNPAPYKTMRFTFNHSYGSYGEDRWPWIKGGEEQSWRDDETFVMRFKKGDTFLKAFYGAPTWTRGECAKFKRAFATVGVQLKRIPSKFISEHSFF